MGDKVLGIDVGGTNLRGGVVDCNASISDRKKILSGADTGITALVENLLKFIDSYSSHHEFKAVSLGIPGIVDSENGILTQAPNIRNVDNYPLKEMVEKGTKHSIPVYIENDANCVCMGEFWTGAGWNCNSMVMLTIGTGLGGGLVFDGVLWRGEDGMGGEAGHIIIDPDGPLCSCGNNGCLESFVSARALHRIVMANKDIADIFSGKLYHEVPEILENMAHKGDPHATAIWKELGSKLGIGITSLVNLLNIEKVVIGGGIANAWELFIDEAKNELLQRGLKAPAMRVSVVRGTLGDDAGILGAAYLAFRRNGNSRHT